MDSIWANTFSGINVSDAPETVMPTEDELKNHALIQSEDHKHFEQPEQPIELSPYRDDYTSGVSLHEQPSHIDYYHNRDNNQYEMVQDDQKYEQQPDDLWQVDPNLPAHEQIRELQYRLQFLSELLQQPEVSQAYQQSVQKLLDEASQEIQDFKTVFYALKTNPKLFVLRYLPEILLEYNISPVLSQEQIAEYVRNELVTRFGEDYHLRTSPEEIFVPGSFSSLVYQTQQQLYNELLQQNARNQELMNQWNEMIARGESPIPLGQPIDPNSIRLPSHEEQTEYFTQEYYNGKWAESGITPDEYIQFLQEASSRQLTLDDIYRIIHFEDYLSEAYRQGVEYGKASYYNNLKKFQGGTYTPPQEEPQQQRTILDPDEFERQILLRNISQGGLPLY